MAKSSLVNLGLDDLLAPGLVLEAEQPKTKRVSKPKKPKLDEVDPLTLPCSSFTIIPTSLTVVPNDFPTLQQPYRIAVIGEAPGRDEEIAGRPFVGMSGQVLTNLLAKAGVLRAACFIGNISQHRPQDNDFNLADPSDVGEGLAQLEKDLNAYSPNICLLLGNTPLRFAHDDASITNWRGSYFISIKPGPFYNRKCIASYHPAACLRNYEWMPLLMFDIIKCSKEALDKTLVLPRRDLITDLTSDEICKELRDILQHPRKISIDIEGGINSMSCISIAESPSKSFIIPFTNAQGDNYWSSFEDELAIWNELAEVLASPAVPKILQNALYDRFVLQYSYSLCVCNNNEDTMLKSWELYCELDKGLGFLCSLYTKEPYYKSDRKSDDMETFWRYCCRDSAVTYEIADRITPMLAGPSNNHYHFNIELLNCMMYMELKGIRYDEKKAKERLEYVNGWLYRLQHQLDTLAGYGVSGLCMETLDVLLEKVQETMCFARDKSRPKKAYETVYPEVLKTLSKGTELNDQEKGYVSIMAGMSLNTKSPVFKTYLYETLGLPKQYGKENEDGVKALTTDGKALLKIQKKQPHPAVELAIQIGELRTRAQMLHISADQDGRVRCGYNVVGASTGRITCYTSPTGSGYNLQTIPDDYEAYPTNHPLRHGMRDLFLADEGYHMFQCDLKGSDGWTIGANMAALGDPSMLDDLRAGIKPASRICYMLRHGNGSLIRRPREEVKELLKEIKKSDWDYFACKVGIWGVCYLMGVDLLADEIMEESQGKMVMSRSEVEQFRNAVFAGYNIKLGHNAMATKLAKSPYLTVPSGHKRRFFSRKTDILGQALAHEPQANTTYATNMAGRNLWRDKENRTQIGEAKDQRVSLRIQPLHQVHDALIGQFKIEDTAWAIPRIRSYFDNEIVIAGIPITIPFEGNYGKNWADLSEGVI